MSAAQRAFREPTAAPYNSIAEVCHEADDAGQNPRDFRKLRSAALILALLLSGMAAALITGADRFL